MVEESKFTAQFYKMSILISCLKIIIFQLRHEMKVDTLSSSICQLLAEACKKGLFNLMLFIYGDVWSTLKCFI